MAHKAKSAWGRASKLRAMPHGEKWSVSYDAVKSTNVAAQVKTLTPPPPEGSLTFRTQVGAQRVADKMNRRGARGC